jgi:hypothetical protein
MGLGMTLTPSPRARAPRFLVQREKLTWAWWQSIKTIFDTPSLKSLRTSARPIIIFRGVYLAGYRPSGKFQSLSLVAHLALIAFALYVPTTIRAREAQFEATPPDAEKIYYRLTVMDPAQKLPRIAPIGEGAKPGKGDLIERLPALGSTVKQRNLTVVSRPRRPDNIRQTIFQPTSPPELRIMQELKLPNIVEARPVAVPKPEFHAKDARPSAPNKMNVTAQAPALTATNAVTPLTDLTDPTKAQPEMPVPPPSAPAPAPTQASASLDASSAPGPEAQSSSSTGSGLVVISTDPGQASDMVALPMGNRYADFSISGAGGGSGAPNGSGHATSGVGTGGGAGGDSSTGLGRGETGGGGGKSGGSGSLSISGSAGGGGAVSGTLGPGVPLSMVYPVMTNMLPRKNATIVSVGSIGGGGLGVYGALKCGKIYTIFMQMPGKAWTLQYCQAGEGAAKTTPTTSTVVHMEQGISPPDPDERFDFKRLPLPEDKIHKLIVLKGLLKEDGTVEGLQVHQGLLPMMDEAARLAFGRWKFRPATRGGKPIAVNILVGVPSDPPPASSQPAQ